MALTHGLRLNIQAEVDSLTVQKAMVRSGGCFTILPPGPILAEVASGELQAARIVDPSIGRTVTLAASLARPDNQACNAIARLALDVARRLIASGQWRGRLDRDDAATV